MPKFNHKGISLKVQLYGLIIVLALLSFAGHLLISVDHTRDYLNEQMASHSQDAATSVGLSISPYMDDENLVIADTMMAAIFDSGYYQSMKFVDTHGAIKLNRENPKSVESVPAWFMNWFALTPPTGSSEVNDGWQIAGTLYVTSHPSISYLQLWDYSVRAFWGSLGILVASLLVAYLILRALLRPITAITAQADAVTKKQFIQNPKFYWTKEVNVLASAINAMVENVQKTFESMTKHAETLTQDAYLDKLTKLGNRRAFESQFKAFQHDLDGHTDVYSIGLTTLPSLQSINRDFGYQAGDDYVVQAVSIIQGAVNEIEGSKVFRTAGGSFIFMLPCSIEICLEHVQQAYETLHAQNSSRYPEGFGQLVVTGFTHDDAISQLLSRLDTMITAGTAQLGSGFNTDSFQSKAFEQGPALGLQDWSALIKDIIATGEIEFSFQPIKEANSIKIIYNELFARFNHNGNVVANAQLFAMAERLNLTAELDKKLILALWSNIQRGLDKPIALNLSRQSLHSDSFAQWLDTFMQDKTGQLDNLYFEINETALIDNINSATAHIKVLKSYGIKLCIEHFGVSLSSFKYLRGLDIDFIKLDGSYVRDLMQNPDNNYFIQAVTQICHGLGIKVIACHVEDVETYKSVTELHCDACQGQFIQPPMRLSQDCLKSECNEFLSTLKVIRDF